MRLLNNVAIFITLAVAYNLINGVCGQLHLGPNAFITLGAYTAALLTMTPAEKTLNFLVTPLYWPLSQVALPFPAALLAGGWWPSPSPCSPVFRSFGCGGITWPSSPWASARWCGSWPTTSRDSPTDPWASRGLAPYTNLWWSWGVAVAATAVIAALVNSSYGRTLKAIREDETAARAMGVNTFRHLLGAYLLSAFWFGVGGGLLAHLITTISPSLFTFFLTFNLLIIIVVGGLGSTTGAVVAAAGFTLAGEWLRVVEEPATLFGFNVPGIPGMRMVMLSLALLLMIIFCRRGLMGRREFSWAGLGRLLGRRRAGSTPGAGGS